MIKSVRRGYSPDDEHYFKGPALEKLKCGAEDLYVLLNRGYPMKGASTFVGNHYQLSERQRIALTRVVAMGEDVSARKAKEKRMEDMAGETVNIDGFNAIIPLEVAQSGSPVFRCMDGTYRDLAGLRGTYGLIDKTDASIRQILSELKRHSIKRGVFWLDAPVSNSGRLKTRIAEIAEEMGFEVGIEVVDNVDQKLYELPNVISSDSIILEHCPGWLNLNERIMPRIPGVWIIDIFLKNAPIV
jgi:hypothetical protein